MITRDKISMVPVTVTLNGSHFLIAFVRAQMYNRLVYNHLAAIGSRIRAWASLLITLIAV